MSAQDRQSILVVDDHQDIREVVRVLLEAEGYEVREASDGKASIEAVEEAVPDLVIMDIMMPGMSGFEAAGEIRQRSSVPILFLTARSGDQDKVLAYSAGADDYLQKPFSHVELVTKVRALLRRFYIYRGAEQTPPGEALECRGLSVSQQRNKVTLNGEKLSLTETEYEILRMLLSQQGQIFTAQEIFESIWHEPYLHASNNTIMVHIRNLRKKLGDDPRDPTFIRTVWGRGYKID